jgi:hypothetical protein
MNLSFFPMGWWLSGFRRNTRVKGEVRGDCEARERLRNVMVTQREMVGEGQRKSCMERCGCLSIHPICIC